LDAWHLKEVDTTVAFHAAASPAPRSAHGCHRCAQMFISAPPRMNDHSRSVAPHVPQMQSVPMGAGAPMHMPAHAAHAPPFWPAGAGVQENIVTLLGVPLHATDWQLVDAMRRFGEISAEGIIRCGLSPQHAPDGAQTVTCLIRFADCYGTAYGASAAAAAAAREVVLMGQAVQVHLGRLAAEPVPLIHQQLSRMAQLLGSQSMLPMEEKAQGGMVPSQWHHPHAWANGPAPPAQLPPGRASSDDWQCAACGNVNFAYRARCNRCRKPSGLTDHQNVLLSSICPVTVMLQSVPQGTTYVHALEALSPFGELVLAMPSMTPAKLAKHLAKYHGKGGLGPLHFFCRFALEASARAAVKQGEVTILGHQVAIRHAYSRQRGGPAAACYHPGPGHFMLAPSAIGGQYHPQCAGHTQYAASCAHPGYCQPPHPVPMLKSSQSMSSEQLLVNDAGACMWSGCHEVMSTQVVGGVHMPIEQGAPAFNHQHTLTMRSQPVAAPAGAYSQRPSAYSQQIGATGAKSMCASRVAAVVEEPRRSGATATPTAPSAPKPPADAAKAQSAACKASADDAAPSPPSAQQSALAGASDFGGGAAKKAAAATSRAATTTSSKREEVDSKSATLDSATTTKPAANGKPPPNSTTSKPKKVPTAAMEEAAAPESLPLGANGRPANKEEADGTTDRLVYAVRRLHLQQPPLDGGGKEQPDRAS